MKKPIILLSVLLYSLHSYCNTIKAVTNNGNWMQTSTWDLARVPGNGDTVIIPNSKTVQIISNINLSTSTVAVDIQGTLFFNGGGAKISFNSSSSIIVEAGGLITSTSNASQTISIGSNTVYQGTQGTLAGPQYANSTTGNGFQPYFVSLPVKFNSFDVSFKNKAVYIQWTTSEELNSYSYIVEKSTDGTNWISISSIAAAGYSNSLSSYSYTDNSITNTSIIYYRIKEIDRGGTFYYSAVKSIKLTEINSNGIIISSSLYGKVYISFSQMVRGNVDVQFISTDGRIISKQTLNQPFGQIQVSTNSNLKGNYFVLISNGQDIHTSKQVIL